MTSDATSALPVNIDCGSAEPTTMSPVAASIAALAVGPSVSQQAAIHEATRLLRLANDKSNAAIAFQAVQTVRRDAAASVNSIRWSDYGDAQSDLQNQMVRTCPLHLALQEKGADHRLAIKHRLDGQSLTLRTKTIRSSIGSTTRKELQTKLSRLIISHASLLNELLLQST